MNSPQLHTRSKIYGLSINGLTCQKRFHDVANSGTLGVVCMLWWQMASPRKAARNAYITAH